eukprot:m.288906 g.288906  ORF g.288906 m.288906 type:complete len:196 (+) comp19455_c2_seq1:2026-2613(+)
MDLTFSIDSTRFGETVTTELIKDGSNVPVTNENRHDFVHRYIQHVLKDSVAAQFESFAEGFYRLFNQVESRLCRASELELLVCGSSQLDFDELERGALYEGAFDAEHPTIKAFWEVAHGLPEAQKRQLLVFATGSDRVPIEGLASVNHFHQTTSESQSTTLCVPEGGCMMCSHQPASHTHAPPPAAVCFALSSCT